jgi:hypothetical protein
MGNMAAGIRLRASTIPMVLAANTELSRSMFPRGEDDVARSKAEIDFW